MVGVPLDVSYIEAAKRLILQAITADVRYLAATPA